MQLTQFKFKNSDKIKEMTVWLKCKLNSVLIWAISGRIFLTKSFLQILFILEFAVKKL